MPIVIYTFCKCITGMEIYGRYETEGRTLKQGPAVVAEITKVVDSTRANFRNETSMSKIVSVKALRPVNVAAVNKLEPYVIADAQPINVTAGGHPTPNQVQYGTKWTLPCNLHNSLTTLSLVFFSLAPAGGPDGRNTEGSGPDSL